MSATVGDVEMTDKSPQKNGDEDVAFIPNGRKKEVKPTGMAACLRSSKMPP
jgi:hypothetical protein